MIKVKNLTKIQGENDLEDKRGHTPRKTETSASPQKEIFN